MPEKSLYEILKVAADATAEEIKKAFREISKISHPDKGGDEEEFKTMTFAYMVLSNVDRRKRYDAGEDPRKGGAEPKRSVEEQAVDVVTQMFCNRVEGAWDIDTQDILSDIKNDLLTQKKGFLAQKKNGEKVITKYQKAIKRLRRKAKSDQPNLIEAACKQKILQTEMGIANLDEQTAIVDAAVKYLAEFDLEIPVGTKPSAGRKTQSLRGGPLMEPFRFGFDPDDL